MGLAEYYAVVSDYAPIPSSESNPPTKINAKKALAVDDAVAEAHAVLGIAYDTDWAWSDAEREFQRALALDPNNSRTQFLYAYHLDYLGNFDESLAHYKRAVELDPLNLTASFNFAAEHLSKRQYDTTIEMLKKTLEIDPNFAATHCNLSAAYLFKGDYESWLVELEKCNRLNNDADGLARVEAAKQELPKTGFRGALRRVIALQEQQSKRIYIDPLWTAESHALLGEKDQAFAWLEKAYGEKSGRLAGIKGDPALDSLHSDPRYANLLKRMGLPQ